jgi:hypothetical protein
LKILVSVVRFRLEAPYNSLLVQLVERRTVNPYVAGSSPAKGATLKSLVFGRGFFMPAICHCSPFSSH